jgi:hypothetical protein
MLNPKRPKATIAQKYVIQFKPSQLENDRIASGHSRISVWWKALRYHFRPSQYLPSNSGHTRCLGSRPQFLTLYFFLVLVRIVVNHLALSARKLGFESLPRRTFLKQKKKPSCRSEVLNPFGLRDGQPHHVNLVLS